MTAVVARLRRPWLTTEYEHGLRLLPTRASWCWAAVLAVVFAVIPLSASDFTLSVLTFAGDLRRGRPRAQPPHRLHRPGIRRARLLHGRRAPTPRPTSAARRVSRSGSGSRWPPPIGGVIGGAVGPFALRLRGNYLAIVSVGLLFIGLHVWNNFESVTGGPAGVSAVPPVKFGSLDVNDLHVFGRTYSRQEAWFWFTWALVAVCGLLCKNIVRSRPGRAMQAVRDRDAAAAVVGVNLARYKVGAFVLSSAPRRPRRRAAVRLCAVRLTGRMGPHPLRPVHRHRRCRRGGHDLRPRPRGPAASAGCPTSSTRSWSASTSSPRWASRPRS